LARLTNSREEIDLSREWDTLRINPGPESQIMVQSLQHLIIEHAPAIQGSRISNIENREIPYA